MKVLEFLNLLEDAGMVTPASNPELVFDDHGSFRALNHVVIADGKIILVLDPHPR